MTIVKIKSYKTSNFLKRNGEVRIVMIHEFLSYVIKSEDTEKVSEL